MRLLYVITQGECGGAQKQVLDLAIYMYKIGHKVFVATGRQETLSNNWLFENLKRAGFKESDLFIIEDLQREIKIKKDSRAFFSIYRLIKSIKPHIVHAHSTKAGILVSLAAKIAGSRVVYTVHGFVFSEPMSFPKKTFYILAELTASFFRDQTIVVSEADLNQGKKYKILRGDKGVVIYNGLDENLSRNILDRESARRIICEKAGIFDKEAIIIGVVANLYRTKGIEYLIEAAEKINHDGRPDLRFVVIGEGELRREFEKKVRDYKMGKSFFLVGSIEQAYRLLRAFDLVVLPSVKEGFPYILLEATLAGIPIVATRVGGVVELSRYISLSLANPADSDSLAKMIISVINSVKTSDKLFGGKRLHRRLMFSNMANSLVVEYERVLGYSLQNPICRSFLLTVPCFNEENVIKKTLLNIHEYLIKEFNDIIRENRLKCCVAINGTTDKTEQAVIEMTQIMPYLTYNIIKEKGRGRALSNLWKNSNEDVFIYFDADSAYSLKDIDAMIRFYLHNENYDLVVASRRVKGSFVARHPLRIILTEGYNYLIKALFWNDFTDAQAGCKSVTRSAFSRIRTNLNNYSGWFFDTALLLYAENNEAKIKDLSITCIDNRKWRLKIISTIFYFIKNLFTLRVKTLLWGWTSRNR